MRAENGALLESSQVCGVMRTSSQRSFNRSSRPWRLKAHRGGRGWSGRIIIWTQFCAQFAWRTGNGWEKTMAKEMKGEYHYALIPQSLVFLNCKSNYVIPLLESLDYSLSPSGEKWLCSFSDEKLRGTEAVGREPRRRQPQESWQWGMGPQPRGAADVYAT